jgi:membrane protein implicated in regulation of membrane protease activity
VTDYWFWTWVGLAAVLIVAEIFTQSFFKGAFGIGAIVAAVLAHFEFPTSIQVAAVMVVAIPLLLVARKKSQSRQRGPVQPIAAERLLGRVGVVLHAIRPHVPGGLVRVDREEWSAECEDPYDVPEGAEIEVVRVDGARLIVKPRRAV